MRLGTNNRATIVGMIAGLRFARDIGHEKIYTRIHQLARTAFDKARQLPYAEMLTPDDDRMFGSLVSIRFKKDPAKLWEACRQKRIWISPGADRLRLSTHIHTRPSDLDEFFETARTVMG